MGLKAQAVTSRDSGRLVSYPGGAHSQRPASTKQQQTSPKRQEQGQQGSGPDRTGQERIPRNGDVPDLRSYKDFSLGLE